MTNPNNALGTNGAFGGRTSVNAFNDVLGAFQGRGILSGWTCSPSSGMTIALGGDGTTRDVAVAEDNSGNRTTINNISQEPVELELASAPTVNSRIDAIVVYVDPSPQGSSSAVDNYGAVHILDVQGSVSSSPEPPTDSEIRSAITADGSSGATAYYVVLATVTVATGTTDITSDAIAQGDAAKLLNAQIGDAGITSQNLDLANYSSSGALSPAVTHDNTTNYNDLITATIPETGKYLVFGGAALSCSTASGQVYVRTRGSRAGDITMLRATVTGTGTTSIPMSVIGIKDLSAGETLALQFNQATASTTLSSNRANLGFVRFG